MFTHVLWYSGYDFSKMCSDLTTEEIIILFTKKKQINSIQEVCTMLNNGYLASDLVYFIPVDIENNMIGSL